MKKLQSFFIMKFNTNKLKKSKFNIEVSLRKARINNNLVRVGDCALFRHLRKYKKQELDANKLKSLEVKQMKLRTFSKKDNVRKLENIQEEIDKILFIPELIEIVVDDVRHYENIIKIGLFVNGKRFVRLLASAGMARRSTVMFCEESHFEHLMKFMECGRNLDYNINPAKYNAYVALSTSGGHEIEIPKFCVVADKEVKRMVEVEWVSENPDKNADPFVERKVVEQTFNLWDGQGLCSRTFANKVAWDLEFDYTPSAMIFRGAFSKGLLVTMDFKEFAELNNAEWITDIYGEKYRIQDLDVILTQSQFKLAGAYQNLEQYLSECKKHDFNWTIVRVNSNIEEDETRATYQYLQILDLNDEQITKLCLNTVNYFTALSGFDWAKVIIFLTGSLKRENIDVNWFHQQEDLIKLLLYNKEFLRDKFVRNKLRRMINRQIRDSYEGKVRIDGNYQFMISDPYAMMQYVCGQEVTGLLKEREFYSNYWNEKGINRVSAIRSPCTHPVENNILDLKTNSQMEYWYRYIKSGIVYNVFDNSTMLHSGSD